MRLREPPPPEICRILSNVGFTTNGNRLERRKLVNANAMQQARLTRTLEGKRVAASRKFASASLAWMRCS